MNKKTDSQVNSLKISEGVITKIVRIAAGSIEGVAGFTKAKIRLGNLFSDAEDKPEIDVSTENGTVDITVNVVLSQGSKVKQVAERIQNKVKNDIQNMTGIAVTRVNVIVEDITLDNKEN